MRSSHIFKDETEMLVHPIALSLEEEKDESDFEKGLVFVVCREVTRAVSRNHESERL